MHELARFVRSHPNAIVGRPALAPSLGGALLASGACAGAIALAVSQSQRDAAVAVVGVMLALSAIAVLASLVRPLRDAVRACLQGTNSYAISDDALLLVDPDGAAVVIDLGLITALELHGSEPRIWVDSDDRGQVYRTMFALFDEDFAGPDAERFFEVLAPRLHRHTPSALVVRHDVSEHGMPA